MYYHNQVISRIRQEALLHGVMLELTYNCNLDCFFCYNDRDKRGQRMSLDDYRTLLTDLADMQTMFIMLTGGEPMVHPQFFKIGQLTKELGFVTRIRTNGHSLTRKMAERVKHEIEPYQVEVSLHGATAATHDRQTRVPGSFDRLVTNITHAKQAGLRLGVVTTPTAWNEAEIDAMYDLTDELGVSLRFQGPVAPRDNGDTEPLAIQPSANAWAAINAQESRRRPPAPAPTLEVSENEADELPKATCSVGVSGVDIDPYGNVLACMHLQTVAGNVYEQRISDIWHNSPVFQRARGQAIDAAKRFEHSPPTQLGAPVFCVAVEVNSNKGKQSGCGSCKQAGL